MNSSRRVLLVLAALTVLFTVTLMSRAWAGEYRHYENSLNHLGITPQSVSHNSSLIRRAKARETRRINPVNNVEPYGGGGYCVPCYGDPER